MKCAPIFTTDCDDESHPALSYDLRRFDNILVTQVGVGEGSFHREGDDIPVILLDVAGESFIGEPHSSTDTIVDEGAKRIVMIPLPLLQALCAPLNEAMDVAEDRQSA